MNSVAACPFDGAAVQLANLTLSIRRQPPSADSPPPSHDLGLTVVKGATFGSDFTLAALAQI
jgi:hypothetical protein